MSVSETMIKPALKRTVVEVLEGNGGLPRPFNFVCREAGHSVNGMNRDGFNPFAPKYPMWRGHPGRDPDRKPAIKQAQHPKCGDFPVGRESLLPDTKKGGYESPFSFPQ